MKTHYKQFQEVDKSYYRQASEAWEAEGLIPDYERSCDGRMMLKENEKFFTDDMDKVTCKLCIRRWNKFAREQ